MGVFVTPMTVRFQHCDPAGIVFYPRYYEMLNLTVERFFDERVGWSFVRLQNGLGVTVPTVRIETTFQDPSWLEDRLEFHLEIVHMGRSSVTFAIEARCGDAVRLSSRQTLVCIEIGAKKSTPWPDVVRVALEGFRDRQDAG